MSERKFESVKPQNAGVTYVRASKLYDDDVNGEVLQGVFVGTIPNTLDERKHDFKFEKENGSIVIVNSAGNLAYNMKFVEVGDFIRICYHGKQEIQKGPQKGREAHNFSVERELA